MCPVLRPAPRPRFRRGSVSGGTTHPSRGRPPASVRCGAGSVGGVSGVVAPILLIAPQVVEGTLDERAPELIAAQALLCDQVVFDATLRADEVARVALGLLHERVSCGSGGAGQHVVTFLLSALSFRVAALGRHPLAVQLRNHSHQVHAVLAGLLGGSLCGGPAGSVDRPPRLKHGFRVVTSNCKASDLFACKWLRASATTKKLPRSC